jgi:hypothetical protein
MSPPIIRKTGWLVLALSYALATQARAEDTKPVRAPGAQLEIAECVVFSERDSAKRFDCTAKAREVCAAGPAGNCALPIGLALSGGRDLDGNKDTWEKVRVKYRCGRTERINGPHHQNDHATVLLACGGG